MWVDAGSGAHIMAGSLSLAVLICLVRTGIVAGILIINVSVVVPDGIVITGTVVLMIALLLLFGWIWCY